MNISEGIQDSIEGRTDCGALETEAKYGIYYHLVVCIYLLSRGEGGEEGEVEPLTLLH